MRWTCSLRPKRGDIRIVRRFLFFPHCIEGEYRWLESVQIRQRFFCSSLPFGHAEWEDIEWVEEA